MIYIENFQVAYIFIANSIASVMSLLLLLPFYFEINYKANFQLLKKMLVYGFPILISGLAFTINETFDLIFLDADKENYVNYYNLIIDKLRVGGLIIADNVLWSGKVLKKNSKDEATKSLIEFNKLIKNDNRVHNVIIPVRDGLNLIYKN